MKASDIMTVGATTVRPDTSVQHAALMMLQRGISGLPVVDGHGHLVGIVTEHDLMRREEIGTERRPPRRIGVRELAQEFTREHGRKVKNVMSNNVASIGPDASLSEIVDLMEARHVKRLPVVDEGKVVGIVSRSNLLQALSRRMGEIPQSVVDDLGIRKSVTDEIAGKAWASGAAIDVIVRDGIVFLNGTVPDEHVHEAVRIAAQNAPGTVRVQDNIRIVRGRYGHMHDALAPAMDRYIIERRGGFTGLKVTATIDSHMLDPKDRETLENFLRRKKPLPKDPGADRFMYVITCQSASGSVTREVPESMMPRSVANLVKERI